MVGFKKVNNQFTQYVFKSFINKISTGKLCKKPQELWEIDVRAIDDPFCLYSRL